MLSTMEQHEFASSCTPKPQSQDKMSTFQFLSFAAISISTVISVIQAVNNNNANNNNNNNNNINKIGPASARRKKRNVGILR